MKIPKNFKLRGQTYKVALKDIIETEGAVGTARFLTNKIELQKTHFGEKISTSQVESTFWHEAAHIILFSMDEHELNENEKFVNQLGVTLYELFNTLKF